MRAYNIVLYVALLALVVFALYYAEGQSAVAPPPPAPMPEHDEEIGGEALPAASEFDEEVWVSIPIEAAPSSGTAFTIAPGVWLTARHVVDGCDRVGLVVQGDSGVLASEIRLAENMDLAVVRAPLERTPLALDLDEARRRLGDWVFMFGYPQGAPGEVAGKLLGREIMQVRGRYATREPVLAWAESSRTRGIVGSLGGISGGPGFDTDGEAIGVVVAEAPRRGRIYTAAPSSLARALDQAESGPTPNATPAGELSEETYGLEGRRLRRDLRVAKVQCMVD